MRLYNRCHIRTCLRLGMLPLWLHYPREKRRRDRRAPGQTAGSELLRRGLIGAPAPFIAAEKWLALISTGRQVLPLPRVAAVVVERELGVALEGLDRSPFHARTYNALPALAPAEPLDLPRGLAGEGVRQRLADLAMRCGGCGAKVGATVLQRALARLHPTARADVLIGLTHPTMPPSWPCLRSKVMVHTVDFFSGHRG